MRNTLLKPILSLSVLMGAGGCFTQGHAEDIVIVDGLWKISYIENDHAFRVNVLNENGSARKCLFTRSASEAVYDNVAGESRTVTPASFADIRQTEEQVNDEFGAGTCYTFTFTRPENGDDVQMVQRFCVYEENDFLITDLSIEGDEAIRSNYLAPVSVSQMYVLFSESEDNRMLKVPFDNDGWTRYNKYKMDTSMTSYEVAAWFNGETKEGMVIGAVDHDHWKNAISVEASDNGRVNVLKVYSGASTSETRDVLPHGKLKGPKISSARMFVGFADDWRAGMETFARANTMVRPMRDTWDKGTPFGWQSWGVLEKKNSFDADVEIADYYHEVLKPNGFVNSQGMQIIGIDSWDNLSTDERIKLCKEGGENGQTVGLYFTPFSWWWGWGDKMGSTQYTAEDCFLKVNGEPYSLGGAMCLDPTHPGTKAWISTRLQEMKKQGFRFLKLDFTSHGMVQADSYYAKGVTTAMEAYNNGLSYLTKVVDEGDEPMFLSFSISPLFPYHYGNSRRVGCDTWADIGQTEYCMNAISGGWWTDLLYQYNDPDHLVMVGSGGWGSPKNCTLGENRARFTSGAVTGMMMVADNFALNDDSGNGDAPLSRARAQEIMMNKDVNEMADLGRSFMPVYGHKEHNGNADAAETCFMHHTEEYLYVAVFNYTDKESAGSIPLSDLEIAGGDFDAVKELWSGETVLVDGEELSYKVPAKDVKVFRFHKKPGSGIADATSEEGKDVRLDVHVLSGSNGGLEVNIDASAPLRKIDVFDLQGRLLKSQNVRGVYNACVALSPVKGLLLLRACLQEGQVLLAKAMVH